MVSIDISYKLFYTILYTGCVMSNQYNGIYLLLLIKYLVNTIVK